MAVNWADVKLVSNITKSLQADEHLIVNVKCYNKEEMEATRKLIPEDLHGRIRWTYLTWKDKDDKVIETETET